MKNPHINLVILCIIVTALFIDCSSKVKWQPVKGDIMTKWAKNVSPENVWQEYPRPQMVRKEWKNLNGLWEYGIRPKNENQPQVFDGHILVPFPIESALSGVKKAVGKDNRLWYRRVFDLSKDWQGKQILLHFGAVDWETQLWVNGQEIGTHRGGYDGFSFDITEALHPNSEQEIVLAVWDPTDAGYQPRGKQVANPNGIWYTAVTGIWQTVWLEPVNPVYIKSLKITPDIDEKMVRVVANCSEETGRIKVSVFDEKSEVSTGKGKPGEAITILISDAKYWSPDSPFLYDLEISLEDGSGQKIDYVESYVGMRKISLGKDKDGIQRLFLNNKELFQHGPLDQGWWPDGLYTAPTDAALRYDIEVTKKLGFNMARKHVKIEPARWYYWCDTLGLLVWQDMPSGDKYIGHNDPDIIRSDPSAEQFKFEIWRMVDGLYNHPSIVMWVPFNEGWGQFETEHITSRIKAYDPTRLVNNTSGWADRGVGDVCDIHAYPGPAAPPNEPNRAAVLGEYGGLGLPIEGHTWRTEKNWGYRGYQNAEELIAAYQDLSRKLQPLIKNGLAAAVYTQTTDVEIEVNGLMTYDRAIIKMNPERVSEFNRGY